MHGLPKGTGIELSDSGTAQSSITLLMASINALPETASEGAVAATFSIVGDDYVAPASFIIISDPSGFFEITGNELRVTSGASFDYETTSSYTIAIEGTDGAPNTYSKTVFIAITNVNEAPLDISLNATTISEDAEIGDTIATISSGGDPDAGDTATYTIINDPDNKFLISGTDLKVDGALDYATDTSHNVTIRVSDSGGLFYDELFTIDVTEAAGTLWNTTAWPNKVAGYDGSRQAAGDVAAWTDYFGNGNDAVQGSAGRQPRNGDDTLGGLNVLTFDGTNDNLVLPANVYGLPESDYCIIGLLKSNGSVIQRLFSCLDGSSSRAYIQLQNGVLRFSSRSAYSTGIAANYGVGNWFIFTVFRSGTTESISVNGNTPVTSLLASSPPISEGSIGNYPTTNTSNLDGNIAQLMFADAAQSLSEIQKAEGRLAHKYGVLSILDAGHPYKTNPPMV